MVSALKHFSPPWLILVLSLEWLVLLLMDRGAILLNYRSTTDGSLSFARASSDFCRGTWTGMAVRSFCWIRRRLRDAHAHLQVTASRLLRLRISGGRLICSYLVRAMLAADTARGDHLFDCCWTLVVALVSGGPASVGAACRLLIFRTTPTWLLISLFRASVRWAGLRRAAIRFTRLILRTAPWLLLAARLALAIAVHGRASRTAPPLVAPLPRA